MRVGWWFVSSSVTACAGFERRLAGTHRQPLTEQAGQHAPPRPARTRTVAHAPARRVGHGSLVSAITVSLIIQHYLDGPANLQGILAASGSSEQIPCCGTYLAIWW